MAEICPSDSSVVGVFGTPFRWRSQIGAVADPALGGGVLCALVRQVWTRLRDKNTGCGFSHPRSAVLSLYVAWQRPLSTTDDKKMGHWLLPFMPDSWLPRCRGRLCGLVSPRSLPGPPPTGAFNQWLVNRHDKERENSDVRAIGSRMAPCQ